MLFVAPSLETTTTRSRRENSAYTRRAISNDAGATLSGVGMEVGKCVVVTFTLLDTADDAADDDEDDADAGCFSTFFRLMAVVVFAAFAAFKDAFCSALSFFGPPFPSSSPESPERLLP